VIAVIVASINEPLPSREALAAAAQAQQARLESEKQARERERQQESAVAKLGTDLKNLGYDLSIQRGKAGEIVIGSDDFEKTDERVRFLALLRGKHSPMVGPCGAGFGSVRLRSGWFGSFNEPYELNCYAIRIEGF
jgi:hypothetical protein